MKDEMRIDARAEAKKFTQADELWKLEDVYQL